MSSTPGINILGTSDNTKLYCYSEDLVSPTSQYNNIAIYNIGSDKTSWNEAPSNLYDIAVYQANTNGNIVATADGGVWVAQTRSSGNNTPGVHQILALA